MAKCNTILLVSLIQLLKGNQESILKYSPVVIKPLQPGSKPSYTNNSAKQRPRSDLRPGVMPKPYSRDSNSGSPWNDDPWTYCPDVVREGMVYRQITSREDCIHSIESDGC